MRIRTTVWKVAPAIIAMTSEVAQAQSNVEVYGIVDTAVEWARSGDGVNVNRLVSGQNSASRFGMRGSEDIGGGLKANFWLENGFNTDTGALSDSARLFNRRATVGLSGPWGRVDLGRQFRPEARAVFGMDPFDGGSTASPSNTYSNTVFRTDNAVVYETPNVNGFVGRLMYAFGEAPGAFNGANNDVGASLQYYNGPVYLAYAYDARTNATNSDKRRWHSLGGAYDFGVAKLYAAYRTRKEGAVGLDESSYWLGVSVPLGAWTLSATATRVNDKTPADKGATGIGLGADYALSKRTTLYGRFGKVNNKNGATFNLDNGINGPSPSSLALGLRHKF